MADGVWCCILIALPAMVPALPFSVLFIAIVEAQAPECYTRSDMFLGLPGCLPPKPPELSMVVVPTPTEEGDQSRRCLLASEMPLAAAATALHDRQVIA
jgi:hypothetical protein